MPRADFGELCRACTGTSCSDVAHGSIFLTVTLSKVEGVTVNPEQSRPAGGVLNGLIISLGFLQKSLAFPFYSAGSFYWYPGVSQPWSG